MQVSRALLRVRGSVETVAARNRSITPESGGDFVGPFRGSGIGERVSIHCDSQAGGIHRVTISLPKMEISTGNFIFRNFSGRRSLRAPLESGRSRLPPAR
jgi:hypothetical protein